VKRQLAVGGEQQFAVPPGVTSLTVTAIGAPGRSTTGALGGAGGTATATVAAELRLPHGTLFRVGKNDWYLAPAGAATAVLKIRQGQVEEIGIAAKDLTGTALQRRTLMTSFG
jgi:hypothetical protein